MNRVNLIGKITDEAMSCKIEGKDVAIFELSTREYRLGPFDEQQVIETPVPVYAWGRFMSPAIQHMKEGDQVAVEGILRFVEYPMDDEGGICIQKGYIVEVQDLIIL